MNKRASLSNIRINENPQIRSENAHIIGYGTGKTSYFRGDVVRKDKIEDILTGRDSGRA